MDSWLPLVGSSFDSIGQQRQGYTGLNQSTELANAAAAQKAAEDRNAYIFSQQQLQAAAAQQQAAVAQANADRERQQSQFGQQLALQQSEDAAKNDFQNKQLQAGIDAGATATTTANQDALFKQAMDEVQAGTFDPKNYSSLPPDKLAYLSRIFQPQKQADTQNYFNAVDLAGKLNTRTAISKTTSKGAPSTDDSTTAPNEWWNPAQWLGAGAATRAIATAGMPTPNTNWFSAMKTKQDAIDQSLGAAGIAVTPDGDVQLPKGTTLDNYGLTYDTKTGQYKPIAPSWAGFGQRGTAPAPSAPQTENSQIPTVTNQQDYDSLPVGSQYYDATGNLRVKKSQS